ncbi:hypothetical protein SEVIR_2G018401v4 [Setaria viridis]
MDLTGGEVPAKPSAAAGEDRLSALPNDILVLILLRLGTAAAAGRTSVLSHRWRRLWALLPVLRFPVASLPRLISSALAARDAALRHLRVERRWAPRRNAPPPPPPPPSPWRRGSPSPRAASPAIFSTATWLCCLGAGRRMVPGKGAPLSCPATRMPPSSPSTWGFSASPCRPPASSRGSPSTLPICGCQSLHGTSDIRSGLLSYTRPSYIYSFLQVKVDNTGQLVKNTSK